MKKLLLIIPILFAFSCSPLTHTVIREETITNYVDSTRWHDSTVVTYLQKERYVDVVKPLDTLNLETSYAAATAYLDTSMQALKGEIHNKSNVPIKTQIKWKEKLVYRDTTIYKEVPVEVVKEVTKYPKSYWWLLGISIASAAALGIRIYMKIKFKK